MDPFEGFESRVNAMQKRTTKAALVMLPIWLLFIAGVIAGIAYAVIWIHRHW